jgi:hypothetical protein
MTIKKALQKHAAQPTLVVKISDTSLPGKAGSNPAFGARTEERGLARLCMRLGAESFR